MQDIGEIYSIEEKLVQSFLGSNILIIELVRTPMWLLTWYNKCFSSSSSSSLIYIFFELGRGKVELKGYIVFWESLNFVHYLESQKNFFLLLIMWVSICLFITWLISKNESNYLSCLSLGLTKAVKLIFSSFILFIE